MTETHQTSTGVADSLFSNTQFASVKAEGSSTTPFHQLRCMQKLTADEPHLSISNDEVQLLGDNAQETHRFVGQLVVALAQDRLDAGHDALNPAAGHALEVARVAERFDAEDLAKKGRASTPSAKRTREQPAFAQSFAARKETRNAECCQSTTALQDFSRRAHRVWRAGGGWVASELTTRHASVNRRP